MTKAVDYLDQLEELALGSRLKRLSDRFLADIAAVYQSMGIQMQPRWFALLALLNENESCSIVDASSQLGISQPAISQMSQQLVSAGLVTSEPGENDSRRRVLKLTRKGKDEIEKAQPVWKAVREAAKDLSRAFDNNFYDALKRCEKANQERSLLHRTMDHLSNSENDG